MKPREKKPKTVYRIIDEDGEPVGSYSRAYCDEYDFGSVEGARNANVHDMFKDRVKYKIAKYRVTYELIDGDVDPPCEKELKEAEEKAKLEKEMDDLGLSGMDRFMFVITRN